MPETVTRREHLRQLAEDCDWDVRTHGSMDVARAGGVTIEMYWAGGALPTPSSQRLDTAALYPASGRMESVANPKICEVAGWLRQNRM